MFGEVGAMSDSAFYSQLCITATILLLAARVAVLGEKVKSLDKQIRRLAKGDWDY